MERINDVHRDHFQQRSDHDPRSVLAIWNGPSASVAIDRIVTWPSIPAWLPDWLHRHPVALTATISAVNRMHRIFSRRWHATIFVIIVATCSFLVVRVACSGKAAFAMQQALDHAGIVVAVCGLYVASLMSRRRRKLATMHAHSWLIAATATSAASTTETVRWILWPLLWRLVAAAILALLLAVNTGISLGQSLWLYLLITGGSLVGALAGAWLSRGSQEDLYEGSRYTRRPKLKALSAPSNAGLSYWPIAQAWAWGRPENARLLLAAAILTIPGGTSVPHAMLIFITWIIVSYLAALLIAVPHIARAVADWLRSTPITFWAFAWPIARRALLHQFCGTLAGMGALLMLGSSLSTAIYVGTLWLALVTSSAAISLVDSYRGCSSHLKNTLSVLTALLAEERIRGGGIAFALMLTALHLRTGARYERA